MLSHRWYALTQDPERGSVTAMLAAAAVGLLLIVALVIDGGAKLRAIEHANAAADHAARTAGQHLGSAGLLSGGNLVIDSGSAMTAAQNALAAEGVTGSVQIHGTQVTVTTVATQPTVFLVVVGVPEVSGEGSATVRIATGSSGPQP